MNDFDIELGKRIQEFRKQKGITQQDLADMMNILRSTISKMESGSREVSAKESKKLSEIFAVPLENLIGSGMGSEIVLAESERTQEQRDYEAPNEQKNLAEDLRRTLISQFAAEQATLRGIKDRMPRLEMQTRILGIEDEATWCSRHQATVEDLENYKQDILSEREKQLAVVAKLESEVKSLKYAIGECAEFIAGNKQLATTTPHEATGGA